ncbi:prepilin peptidase [Candidatus Uhrbacteria bacterium]|nr:prepilin peptidase [Candidatus Uhrbacteria bacterium]
MEPERLFGIIFAAVLGGILGSFVNVLILRWHSGKGIGGRSSCPQCKKTIKARHLIPVLSWLWLRGKCAYCGKKINNQYVLVEAAALVLGIIAAMRWDPFAQPMFWFEFLLSVALIVPFVMDLRWQELPVEYLIGVGLAGLAFRLFGLWGSTVYLTGLGITTSIFALVATTVFFGLQIILSKGKWLGMGDFYFGLMMAGVLGWPLVVVGVYAAYILGAVVATVGLALGLVRRKSKLPFAPALAAGTMVAVWFGPQIAGWLKYAFI